MRRILLQNIMPGMRLAKPLYNADGTVLFNAGISLQDRVVKTLAKFAVTYVYIEDEITRDIDIPDVVSEQVRIEAVVAAKRIMENAKHGKGVDDVLARKTAAMLVDGLCKNNGNLLSFIDMRIRSDYLFHHAVNVGILAVRTGISLGFDKMQLIELGVGALLHDVGLTLISPKIINKKGRLTPQEKIEIKKHPQIGFETLQKNSDISLSTAYCVVQHHERINGCGYPQKLQGHEIHQFAQLVAIADVYDALISDVAYRNAVPVYEALAILDSAVKNNFFDQALVTSFSDNIAVYPIGSTVRLSNNQIGVVVDISHAVKNKPVVRIIKNENNEPICQWIELDLAKNRDIYIADVTERE